MGTIAKGEITLSPVNDAYTVLLTPASCVINADYDGSNPRLQNATTTLIIKRGTKTVPFSILGISKSSVDVGVSYSTAQTTSAVLKLLGVSKNDLSGWVDVTFRTADGFDYTSTVRFNFTIVRETSMLDWILDWEGSKTKVGGTYIMTPKLFVGHKESVVHTIEHETADSYEEVYEWTEDAITGVYLGPDLLDNKQTVGLYGYYLSKEIFHLNAEGGMIGGWDINEAGISSGNLKILSEGSIIASTSTQTFWALYANGNASFANGNVVFKPNGDASFAGHIESISGKIGGWTIASKQLHNGRIILDSSVGLIGVYAGLLAYEVFTGDVSAPKIPTRGGVTMYYTSSSDFGLVGCSTTATVFQLGSTNFIAGWSFDDQAIYTGTKNTTQHAFTEADSLTISPTGLRSNKWYIDRDGTAKFVGGSVFFDTDKAEMFGWKMRDGRFSSAHAALISNSFWSGVFVSPADLTEIAALSLTQTINNNGGIYMYSDGANSLMRAYDKNGNLGFALQTNGYHTIGNWNFNHQTIYTGSCTPDTSSKFMSESNQMVLSTSIGLVGHKWRLSADGSGAIAGGHISWKANGDIILDDTVTIKWSNVTDTGVITNKLTKIDANGIYTGTISANNITAGTISTASIICDGKWALKADGSGFLAGGKLSWDADGNLKVEGEIIATSGSIAGFSISDGRIGVEASKTGEPGTSNQSTWASLTIYKDFFKVGGNKGYVMFGDDVIPASAGGAFTAVGRIVNNAPNTFASYGIDTANYGLFIDVSGGTKNYGLKSNAAILSPSFVSTGATFLTFNDSGTYSIDFSQNNLILLYAPTATSMSLPSESSVARQFGYYNELPDDFVAIVTIMLRPGSQCVIIKGVYGGTGIASDYPIATSRYVYKDCTYNMQYGGSQGVRHIAPCCITLMISKKDGFRYTLMNYECSLEKA